MLKGVNRQVLEVNRPDSRYFERVMFVVKPEFSRLNAAKLLKEAEHVAGCHTGAPPLQRIHVRRQKQLVVLVCILAAAVCALILALVLK